MATKILAFVNQKGGVGKTTSAVTTAMAWARNGLTTLLVDLDAQGNVADSLGMEKRGDLNRFMIGEVGNAAITTGFNGLHLILGDKSTSKTKQVLSGDPFGVFKLRELLSDIRADVIVLDVAPGADILQLGALVACTHFIIPVSLEHLALVGVREALESVASLKKVNAFNGGFVGVLPTMLNRTIRGHIDRLKLLAESFGRQVAPPIPTDATVGKAQAAGQTLWDFDPGCRALQGVVLDKKSGKPFGGYHTAINWMAQEIGL